MAAAGAATLVRSALVGVSALSPGPYVAAAGIQAGHRAARLQPAGAPGGEGGPDRGHTDRAIAVVLRVLEVPEVPEVL
jgi:hypothetical protein